MSENQPRNVAASVKQRLMNYAREKGDDFNALLNRYAMERLLFRLSSSSHAGDFYLKGAMLFLLWENQSHRPTKDLDLLCIPHYDQEALSKVFQGVISIEVMDDGLAFDPKSLSVEKIREENAYGGLRVKLNSYLGEGRIPMQIDVGLGDSVYPATDWAEFPVLLGFAPPRIRAYPAETVIAEKFQAIVDLKFRNSRMKDYYDIHYLLQNFSFNGYDLHEAIRQTFERRKTEIPQTVPAGLSSDFATDPNKQTQWNAFLRKNRLDAVGDLPAVITQIANFLTPVFTDTEVPGKRWTPDKGWALCKW